MINLIEKFEKKQIEQLVSKRNIPTFRAGDTIKVDIKILEGERSRIQAFEGICVARKNKGVNSNFTIRKISHGEGVERVFPLFSTIVDKIEVIRKGNVKRAKLYYLRNRKGKSARIADKDRGDEGYQYESTEIAKKSISSEEKLDIKEKEILQDSKDTKEVEVQGNNIDKKSETSPIKNEKSDDKSKQ